MPHIKKMVLKYLIRKAIGIANITIFRQVAKEKRLILKKSLLPSAKMLIFVLEAYIIYAMKTISINIPVTIKEESELTADEAKLVMEAKQATYRSYAPYSHFSVGSAVMLADGTTVSGSNQENAAYPSGLCSERTTVFYANSQYPDIPVRRICIVARGTDGLFLARPITPCGACRQVLLETERRAGGNVEVLLYGTEYSYCLRSIKDLMPLTFDSSFL